jgi:hypothetical protein
MQEAATLIGVREPVVLAVDKSGTRARVFSNIGNISGRINKCATPRSYDQAIGRRVASYVYLWADGVQLNVRLAEEKLCLLVVMGLRVDGTKELVALAEGYRESAGSWADLLRDCARRGMRAPVLAVGDGALGVWSALREVFPTTREQLCWFHKSATARHHTKVTNGPGPNAAGLAMAFKLIEAAQARWRAVNAFHLVALVRAGAQFEAGKLVERAERAV